MKKKFDWNAVVFAVLVLVLIKNAALNAASYGSMPDARVLETRPAVDVGNR